MVHAFNDTRPSGASAPPRRRARVPPHDLEAEESLLGAMLLSDDAASVGHRDRARAATSTSRPTATSSGPSVPHGAGRADRRRDGHRRAAPGLMEAIGDPAILVSLQANTPSMANARHYAAIVEEHSLLRKLMGVAGEIAEIGYSVPDDVRRRSTTPSAGLRRGRPAERRVDASAARPARPGLDRIEELGLPRRTITGRGHGLPRARQNPGRSAAGQLNIVGARPGWARPASPWGCWPMSGMAVAAAGAAVLARDGPPGADPAHAGLRGPGERPAACRTGGSARSGLGEDRHGRDPAVDCADLHRRQPERDGDGHPGPGATARRSRGRPRASWWSTTCS